MTAWLHVLGVGEQGFAALPAGLRTIVGFAETVVGHRRFLAEVQQLLSGEEPPDAETHSDFAQKRGLEAVARALLDDNGEEAAPPPPRGGDMPVLLEWEDGIEQMMSQLSQLRDTPTVILATGDPMWFGIGATISRFFEADEFEVHPHPSSFQLAAAAMRWPLQNVETISLHGRPAQLIHPYIQPGNRILALTTDAGTTEEVADILVARGYGESRMSILESLGGHDERKATMTALDVDIGAIGDFYVLAVDCVAGDDADLLPAVPGLPDDAFENDGQLTKREVRAVTLARLAPLPGQLLWDVGAGSGSIAIEWMRAARGAVAIAFERDEHRCRMISANASALGTPTLRVVQGDALPNLMDMPPPDALFLGGGVADDELFATCWDALKPGGRLVSNVVTLDGEAALIARQARHGGELVRIDVSVLDAVGSQKVMRPRMGVLQWSTVKLPGLGAMF